jgi:membrane-associated phospholipid phosphatase
MTSFESLALIYFVALAIAGARSGRTRAFVYVGCAMLLVIVARFLASWELRAWMPHAYLVLGYWIPASFTPARLNEPFEQWLRRADARLKSRMPMTKSQGVGSRKLGFAILELAYLFCYPMVPAAFTVAFVRGDRRDVERFWLAVLLAGYACYGTLPWTAARPPRIAVRDEHARRGVARFNAGLLGRVSHNLNTFPSGHVAVALAATLVVWPISMAWGAAFVMMTVAIAVAAVAGRYHYLVDILGGLVVGVLAWLTAAVAAAGSPGPDCRGG